MHGCLIENSIEEPETLTAGYFYSCVEETSDTLEIKHILLCGVEYKKATFTYIYKSKTLLYRDTVRISTNDSLKSYVIGKYLYDDRFPISESFSVEDYKELLIEMNSKYKDYSDSIIFYNDIPCKKRMFDNMYKNYIDN